MNHRIEKYLAIATVTPLAGGMAAHADTFFHHYGGETPFLSVTLPDQSDASAAQANLTTSQGRWSIGFDIHIAASSDVYIAGMYLSSGDNGFGVFHGFAMETTDSKLGLTRMSEGDKLPAGGPEKEADDVGKLAKSGNGDFAGEGEQRGYVGATIALSEDGDSIDMLALAWFDVGFNRDEGTLTIYDWAWTGNYGDETGPPILYAGQTEAIVPVPGAAGIVALAAGAAGIRRRRQRAS